MTQIDKQMNNNLPSDDEQQATLTATLLFVDDEANILSSLKRLFRPFGYTILTATSGKEGLELLKNNKIDLVISDMRMPEMDGSVFLAHAAEQWPETLRILLTGYADMTSTIKAINEGGIYKYISKPWEDNDITLSVKQALEQKFLKQERDRLLQLTRKQNAELEDLNTNLEDKVKSRTEELGQAMAQLELTHTSLKESYISSVKIFSNLIELRDGAIPGFSRGVADNAYKLAIKVGMNKEDARTVMVAGLLHGIGKIGLPDSLIRKPQSTFSTNEKSLYIKYPVIGQGALMALEPLHDAANLIRSHLEHYDGTGYPDKLKGDDIPVGARILSIANDYESLKAGTFTKDEITMKQIHDFMRFNGGKRYDPKYVKAFIELLGNAINQQEDVETAMSNNLKQGMVLARDIIGEDDILLLAKGQLLTEPLITRIQEYENSIDDDLIIFIKSVRS